MRSIVRSIIQSDIKKKKKKKIIRYESTSLVATPADELRPCIRRTMDF
jgi:hypothetical protein